MYIDEYIRPIFMENGYKALKLQKWFARNRGNVTIWNICYGSTSQKNIMLQATTFCILNN